MLLLSRVHDRLLMRCGSVSVDEYNDHLQCQLLAAGKRGLSALRHCVHFCLGELCFDFTAILVVLFLAVSVDKSGSHRRVLSFEVICTDTRALVGEMTPLMSHATAMGQGSLQIHLFASLAIRNCRSDGSYTCSPICGGGVSRLRCQRH